MVSANVRASLPLAETMDQHHLRAQSFFCAAARIHAAMQNLLSNYAFCLGEIEGSAVKEGIRRKNHMPAGRRDRRFKSQRALFFFRRAGHVGADAR